MQPQQQEPMHWQPAPPPYQPQRPAGGANTALLVWILVLLVINMLLTGYVALVAFGIVQGLNDITNYFGG